MDRGRRFQIELSAALTLGSVGPLYAVPVAFLVKGERTSARGCAGAVLAVAGVFVLCSWGEGV